MTTTQPHATEPSGEGFVLPPPATTASPRPTEFAGALVDAALAEGGELHARARVGGDETHRAPAQPCESRGARDRRVSLGRDVHGRVGRQRTKAVFGHLRKRREQRRGW